MILGEVISIDEVNGLTVLIDGEEKPTQKKYAFANSYTPRVGDRVAIAQIAGTYIVMFAIVKKIR
ncbi:hypothetical protein [Anaerorhabdus furcosa]|uniref:Uncharacterized protein n=1 Tax=Anaerorhabdus furcosa TaxID=118967 RepID=A0A1T4M1Z4_9FIRM|nr:hypothetical protein [Anaerorhabdus furcosa]SJZ60905.1 hypothetical protein SAMN02745191_1148 [Anaerorhabdus furcosa]